jgi:hypothetical protein
MHNDNNDNNGNNNNNNTTTQPERLVERHSHRRDQLDQALHTGMALGLHQHAIEQVQPLLDKGARVVIPTTPVSSPTNQQIQNAGRAAKRRAVSQRQP